MKTRIFGFVLVATFVFAFSNLTFAQGKGKGGNSGREKGGSTGRSDNQSDNGRSKSKKNDPVGAILGDDRKGNSGDNRFKGLSKKTGVPSEALRTRYEIERRLNPDLTYGQFVAAHMIAKNHRGVSPGDILGGLRSGQSIGQVLNDNGWDKGKIEKERKRIKKDREKDKDRDYDDNDRTWRLPF